MRWEYCQVCGVNAQKAEFQQSLVRYLSPDGNHRDEKLDCGTGTALARLGQDGWELIAVSRGTGRNTSGDLIGYSTVFDLKRPIP